VPHLRGADQLGVAGAAQRRRRCVWRRRRPPRLRVLPARGLVDVPVRCQIGAANPVLRTKWDLLHPIPFCSRARRCSDAQPAPLGCKKSNHRRNIARNTSVSSFRFQGLPRRGGESHSEHQIGDVLHPIPFSHGSSMDFLQRWVCVCTALSAPGTPVDAKRAVSVCRLVAGAIVLCIVGLSVLTDLSDRYATTHFRVLIECSVPES
jgi:hypothetical protein